jgi:hypothetical protein
MANLSLVEVLVHTIWVLPLFFVPVIAFECLYDFFQGRTSWMQSRPFLSRFSLILILLMPIFAAITLFTNEWLGSALFMFLSTIAMFYGQDLYQLGKSGLTRVWNKGRKAP